MTLIEEGAMTLRETIISMMHEVAATTGTKLEDYLKDRTVLLETGLDSLGFAILVAKLEEKLGYDPFVLMKEPVYPRDLGEFVDIYARFAP